MDGIAPSDLEIDSLVRRVEEGGIKEVILALPATMEGDTTNYYIFRKLKPSGIEITTLVIAGSNDSEEELSDIARFIAEVDRDIPWHISRFHPDYRMMGVGATPLETLRSAVAIGRKTGLRYIYLGNVVGEAAETLCPGCSSPVIRRRGFWLERNDLRDGQCPRCGTRIAGVFQERRAQPAPGGQRAQVSGNR